MGWLAGSFQPFVLRAPSSMGEGMWGGARVMGGPGGHSKPRCLRGCQTSWVLQCTMPTIVPPGFRYLLKYHIKGGGKGLRGLMGTVDP